MTARKTCDKGECCRQDLQSQLRASLSREAALVETLRAVKKYANEMRKSESLVGPAEYEREPKLRKAWVRARYHDGKDILALIKPVVAD